MKFIRFVLPFLFVRNWFNGAWELSVARTVTFFGFVLLITLGLLVAYLLQAPVVYEANL